MSDSDDMDRVFVSFKLRWRIRVNPNGVISLKLLSNDALFEFDVVAVRCFIQLGELEARYVMRGIFGRKDNERGWGNDRVSSQEFRKLDSFTVKLEMELIDVHHQKINVTQKFIDCSWNTK